MPNNQWKISIDHRSCERFCSSPFFIATWITKNSLKRMMNIVNVEMFFDQIFYFTSFQLSDHLLKAIDRIAESSWSKIFGQRTSQHSLCLVLAAHHQLFFQWWTCYIKKKRLYWFKGELILKIDFKQVFKNK